MLADHPEDAAVERMRHWAVGWIDYLLVRPDSAAAVAAQGWADKLANYPLADEDDYSELEWEDNHPAGENRCYASEDDYYGESECGCGMVPA